MTSKELKTKLIAITNIPLSVQTWSGSMRGFFSVRPAKSSKLSSFNNEEQRAIRIALGSLGGKDILRHAYTTDMPDDHNDGSDVIFS